MFATEKLYYVPKTRTRSRRRYVCYLYENACELQSSECCVAGLILLSVLKSVSYVAKKINKRDRKRKNEQEERRGKNEEFLQLSEFHPSPMNKT